ncbi:MAG: DUF4080 domain-containing protein [Bacilli bacterium]|nr:DUF4080 domain-containing protein [Bacilli bacterium]
MKTVLVGINAKFIHPNLAIRYLYTYTKDEYDVDFIEFTIKEDVSEIVNKIYEYKPSLVGFSTYIWNIEIIKKVVVKLKELDDNIKILFGGPETSYDIEHWFSILPIDYLITGEGEYPFKALLHALENNLDLKHVPQLSYREKDNVLINKEEYVIDLNTLPSPYRLKRDNHNRQHQIQYIESSRGCPFKCSYCLASLEKRVRYFDRDYVKQEILYLMSQGAKTFKFLDRTFNLRKDNALDIFAFIIKNHREGCVFQFEITGELLDEDIIKYLNDHAPKGLIRFEIGIQSTNDYTNRLVNRIQNFAKLKRNILLIQAGGKIDLHLDLIAGLPKEDFQSFTKTFNDVFSLRPQELQLGFLKMLRGTKLREEAPLYKYKYHETAPYEIIENEDLSKDDVKLIHLAEDILEKYYNSHRFDQTLSYIIDRYYTHNNFQFFLEFGAFYQIRYPNLHHQPADLCIRLWDFIRYKELDENIIISLIKYDYLHKTKIKPKIFYEPIITPEERRRLYNHFITLYPNYNLDNLYRYALSEKLFINPLTYEEGEYYLIKLFLPHDKNCYIIKIS